MKTAVHFALVLFSTLAIAVAHAEIYRWVDENGKVHFDERPRNENATRVDVAPAPPIDPTLQQRQDKTNRLLQVIEEERDEERKAAAKAEKEKKKRQKACASARKRLTRFQSSGRLYTKDESGERSYLDDTARDNAIAEAEKQVQQLCP